MIIQFTQQVLLAAGVLAMTALGGCHDNESSTLCQSDTDCSDGGTEARCLVAPVSRYRYCANVDPGCDSGYRWTSSAGDELAGSCAATAVDAGSENEIDANDDDAIDATVQL